MTTKKTKKVSPSKIFNSAINWLNTYLEIVAGGNIKTQRRRLVWLIPVSLLSPFVGILLAWIAKIIWLSTISPLFIILFFTIAIVPWLFLLWLTVALYIPLILLTIPADYSEKLKELNASPENAKKLARFFSDIIAWVLFAGLYCFFFKIWHNILAVVPLLVVVLYFIFATSGKWIEPDPKFKQKLFKAVTFLIFIPLTLSFISPTFYYHIFGSSLSTLSNKYPESQMTNEKLDKTIKKALDKKLAKELQEINDEIKKGKITPEDAEKKQGEIKKKFKNESLLKKTTHGVGNGIKSGIEKVKNIWSSKKPDSNINSKMPETKISSTQPPTQNFFTFQDTVKKVVSGWNTIDSQFYVGNTIIILSSSGNLNYKKSWKAGKGKKLKMILKNDGLYGGQIPIKYQVLNPSTRYEVKINDFKGGEKLIFQIK